MRWSRRGDCGSDGLWVLVDLGGHGMGCGLVFRWLNRCWYGDWVAELVVLVFGGHGMGCGLLVCWWFLQSVVSAIGGFCNRYLLVVSPIGVVLGLVFVGDWWGFFFCFVFVFVFFCFVFFPILLVVSALVGCV